MISFNELQMSEFQSSAQSKFLYSVISHVGDLFPEAVEVLEPVELKRVVKRLLEKARSYEINSEFGQCAYVDTAFIFGENFDVDERLPWAASILAEPCGVNSTIKVRKLTTAASACLQDLANAERSD